MKPIFKKVLQIGIAVKDINKTVRTYADEYGIGPWKIYEFNPDTVKNMIRNDKRLDHRYRIAVCNIGDYEMELMEPLDDKSLYAEFIKEHGEGIQHLAYKVEDYDKAMEFFRSKGLVVTQQGNWFGKFIYTYLGTEKDLKHSVELYKKDPDFVYPEPDEVYPLKGEEDKLPKPIFKSVQQIAVAVKDLKKALRVYTDEYGIGPWSIYNWTPDTIEDMVRNDKRLDHRYRLSTCIIGGGQLELMGDLDDKNLYSEFIKEHGEGIQHIAYEVEDYDKAAEFFRNKGLIITTQGNWLGKFVYTNFSTEKDLKHSIEIFKIDQDFSKLIKYKADEYGNKRMVWPIPDEVYPPEV